MRILMFGILAATIVATPVRAQSGGAYSVDWSSLGAGGSSFAAAGVYRLGGSIGQTDAGYQAAGAYALRGGFWTSGVMGTLDTPRAESLPSRFATFPPAPNPSRGRTRFSFELPHARHVQVTLHDLSGRQVRTLLDGERGIGWHAVFWDGRIAAGRSAPAGVYFIRIVAGEHSATHRFVRID